METVDILPGHSELHLYRQGGNRALNIEAGRLVIAMKRDRTIVVIGDYNERASNKIWTGT
jgi:hypothetical protein